MSGNIFSLTPYIVKVPVCVELLRITMEVTLCVGPFNTKEAAQHWVSQFELTRNVMERLEDLVVEGAFNELGLTRPFLDTHTYPCDVEMAGVSARSDLSLLAPGVSETIAAQIHIHALRALQAAVEIGLASAEGNERH